VVENERPWGGYTILEKTDAPICVKVLTVKPKARLSMQTHEKRAERWFILDAGIVVNIDDEVTVTKPGDVVYVGIGQKHRITNVSNRLARIVELMYGEYDEDDITRIEDDYGRQGI
jgi:mannose-6-phosphate isomerase-like protein (cupin superfamily)